MSDRVTSRIRNRANASRLDEGIRYRVAQGNHPQDILLHLTVGKLHHLCTLHALPRPGTKAEAIAVLVSQVYLDLAVKKMVADAEAWAEANPGAAWRAENADRERMRKEGLC